MIHLESYIKELFEKRYQRIQPNIVNFELHYSDKQVHSSFLKHIRERYNEKTIDIAIWNIRKRLLIVEDKKRQIEENKEKRKKVEEKTKMKFDRQSDLSNFDKT